MGSVPFTLVFKNYNTKYCSNPITFLIGVSIIVKFFTNVLWLLLRPILRFRDFEAEQTRGISSQHSVAHIVGEVVECDKCAGQRNGERVERPV